MEEWNYLDGDFLQTKYCQSVQNLFNLKWREYCFLYHLALCQHIQCTRWVINVFWKSLCSWSSNTPLLAFVPLGCNCVLIVREVMIVRDLLLQLANPIQCTLANVLQLSSFFVLSKMWYTHACLVVSVRRVAWKIFVSCKLQIAWCAWIFIFKTLMLVKLNKNWNDTRLSSSLIHQTEPSWIWHIFEH